MSEIIYDSPNLHSSLAKNLKARVKAYCLPVMNLSVLLWGNKEVARVLKIQDLRVVCWNLPIPPWHFHVPTAAQATCFKVLQAFLVLFAFLLQPLPLDPSQPVLEPFLSFSMTRSPRL